LSKISITVPEQCLPLLREQRTSYRNIPDEYAKELLYTYNSFSRLLPVNAKKIIDIGCGMSGIDVFLHNHYPDADIFLADKQGVSPTILSGFAKSGDWFSYYHDFGAALALLSVNNVSMDKIHCVDLFSDAIPSGPFDVAISLLSWGFHYPIDSYSPKMSKGGVIIADIRKDTNGEKLLNSRGKCSVVFDSKKYRRLVCQC
jgi:hypothetical protein